MEEIRRGISSQAKELQTEDANLGDSGPESYFLAWFLPLVYYLLMILSGLEESRSFGVSYGLLTFGLGASWIGTVWMVYQAFRYEVRPFRYCVAAFLPFTFVWYYVERYRVRQGAQRLPVAVRARLHPPQT